MHQKFYSFLIFLSGFSTACATENVDWKDIQSFREQIIHIRTGDHRSFIQMWKNKKKLNYIESFAMGLAHFKLKEFRRALLFFARSVFISGKMPSKYYPSVVHHYLDSWSNSFKKRSPFHGEALYYVTLCYHKLGENNYAIKFLDIFEDYMNDLLEEKYLELKARIISKLNPDRAAHLYHKILEDFKKPVYHIRIGSIYHKKERYGDALREYFEALTFYKNRWSYKIAAEQMDGIFKKKKYLLKKLNSKERVLLAEGLRLLKQNRRAALIWNQIKRSGASKSMTRQEKFYFTHFYGRHLMNRRKYTELVQFIPKQIGDLSSKEKKTIFIELGNWLLKRDRYGVILDLLPVLSKERELNLIRLQALHKTRGTTREKEARYYLRNFDPDSTIAERAYFSACLDQLKQNTSKSLECLKKLSSLTDGFSTGGRSKYFLAKVFEKKGEKKKAMELYKNIYLRSPSNYFAFKALEKIKASTGRPLPGNDLKEIREWLSGQILKPNQLKKFVAKKKKDVSYAVDSFWKEWESKLEDIDDADEELKRSVLFIAVGAVSLASPYMQELNELDQNLLFQKAGHLLNDAHLKYTYLKRYTIKKKKSFDIFTLSRKARESLYPAPYKKYIEEASKRFGVGKARLYALMKQESNFHPSLVSVSGASGLMQIMPRTARWLNRKLKIRKLDLMYPRHSILLGAMFYAQMSKRLNGDFEYIAISYNAGPGRLSKWRRKFDTSDKDIFLENIPFRETNLYVKRTRSYYDRYKILIQFK